LIAAAACHRKPSVPPDVVARVGERMVTLSDFKRYLDRNTGTDLAQLGPEVASAMTDQYLEEVILSEYAATHGVEIPAEQIASAVRNDAGVTGTPAFYINGRMISGAQPFEAFKKIIDEELARGR